MSDPARVKPAPATRYDADYFAWTQEQAALLRANRFSQVDTENIAEELEDLGRSQKREIRSRLVAVLVHLLKWRYQPGRRTGSWKATLVEQRAELATDFEESPSLRSFPREILSKQYEIARLRASGETKLALKVFPEECPFTVEQVLDRDFLPEDPVT
jgi:hypothetical protein